jgi:uncharacterized membrane protein YkoI
MKTYGITLITALGLLAGCDKGVENASQKFNGLPPAVQKTVRAQYPNGEVADVAKKTENGLDVYEIQFRESGTNPKLVVATDGRLINSDLAKPAGAIERALTSTGAVGTKLSALPEKAQLTIKANAPDAEVADISRQEKNGRVIYVVAFKDKGKNPTIRVADDGSLVQELQTN